MKKVAVLVVATIMAVVLTACSNPFVLDKAHATMIITTSDGRTGIAESYNGLNMTWSGEKAAAHYVNTIELEQGQSMCYYFKCETCEDVQEMKIDYPCSMVISCKCPEKGDEEGNAKEYIALKVVYVD